MLLSWIIIYFGLFFVTPGYNDYGYSWWVNREKYALPFRSYYYDNRDDKVDFDTVLVSRFSKNKDEKNFINYNWFTVYVSHMKKMESPVGDPDDWWKYMSTIEFQNYSDKKIQILSETIQLIHKDVHGNEVSYEIIEETNFDKELIEWMRQFYEKKYSQKLPRKMQEYIYFEAIIDRKREKFEFNFPIEFSYDYNWWDVLSWI